MIASSDIGDIPGGIDEITVGDAERIRVSAKKALFIVGANEGVFPANGKESFVLTDNERRLFKNQGVEIGTDNIDGMRKERLRVTAQSVFRLIIFLFHILQAVSQVKKKVLLKLCI